MFVQDLICGSIAACIAVTVTNPFDLLKTKYQLQSELGAKQERIFGSLLGSLARIYKSDGGLRGIQAGLSAAYAYQICMNGTRFGCYELLKREYNSDGRVAKNFMFGAASGMLGAAVGSPFNLLRVRMQSYSPSKCAAAGDQHGYRSLRHGIRSILNTIGMKGLFEGSRIFVIRTCIGSCAQLAFYDSSKQFFEDSAYKHFLSSLVAGLANAVVICPVDVVTTRLYNQLHSRKHYSGIFDCILKTAKREGLSSFYRGFVPLFLRLGPHTVITFMAYEHLKKVVGNS